MAGEKPTYINSLRCKQSRYGIKVSGQLDKIIEEFTKLANSRGYVNLEIKERKEVGRYGETHSVILDTWEPTGNQQSSTSNNSSTSEEAPASTSGPDDDLPF